MAVGVIWADCPIDSTNSDSTLAKSDSLHVGRVSHHLNSRSSEGTPFDWFANLQVNYKYNDLWNPDFHAEGATEREDGIRYDSYLVGHSTDYYFIKDRVDEEHNIYLFEAGLHYTVFNVRHGYAYMWWSNTRIERHALYHMFEGDWLKAEIQYLDKIYKTELELFYEHKWELGSDEIFFILSSKYLKLYNKLPIWSIGYSVGYEW
jgi:hypothetical protein